MKIIDSNLLRDLSRQAKENSRLRKNFNLHASDAAVSHRLLNAIEPGSYIRPHRHLDPNKDEAFVIISGTLGVVTFDDNGNVTETVEIAVGGKVLAVDVPHGVYHGAVSLQPGTVFFEAKAGPYLPLTDDEKAPWAPEDSAQEAADYLARLVTLFQS